MRNKSAFTLVELIVVITILAILGTIAFLSFNGYSSSARDSARLSDIDSLAKAMEIVVSKWWTLPKPSNAIDIKAGTTTIWYQWYADKTVLGMISMSDSKDPLDSIYYTYSVNASQNKYQVLWFLESSDSIAYNSSPFIDSVYAEPASYSGRTVFTKWNALGILLFSGTLLPAQVVQQNIDTAGTSTGYITYFETKDSTASLTGNLLFSNIYNRRKDLLTDKTLAASDPTLVGYWDMETLTGTLLKDFSNYHNDGICYNNLTSVPCGTISQWPQLISKKGMNFDGIDDYIATDKSILQNNSPYTIIANIQPTNLIKSYARVITFWSLASNDPTLSIYFSTGILNNWRWYNDGSPKWEKTQFSYQNIEQSHFISSIYDKSSLKLTDNSSSVSEISSLWFNWDYWWNVSIGSYNSSGAYLAQCYSWIIKNVRIYNRALSDSEISILYNATK